MSGAVSDFDVVKALIEARNPRLAVGTYEYCEWRTVRGERVRRRFEGVCVGHRDWFYRKYRRYSKRWNSPDAVLKRAAAGVKD